MVKNKCYYCKKIFLNKETRKYCCHKCYGKSKVGGSVSKETREKMSLASKGKPKSAEHIKKVTEANTGQVREKMRSENHPNWKGNNATIGAIHDWVHRHLGSPKKCDHCETTENVWYHWSNKSGKYKRDFSDWQRLCVKCHSKFDREHGMGLALRWSK